MNKNILLLNGSTRIKGNSLNICQSLKRIILDKGLEVDIEHIQKYFNENNIESLKAQFEKADIIGIVAPLYIDGFPYPVIAFLEEVEKLFSHILNGKSLFMVGQCNFPQSERIMPMTLSCKCFSKKLGMKFLGAMAYGGSVVRIEGRTLEEAGKEGKRMIKALELALDDIIDDNEIGEKAKNLFKNDVNKFILKPFVFGANIMFKKLNKEKTDI